MPPEWPPKQPPPQPAQWLRELGATRAAAPAAYTSLVLGEWRDGCYPISYIDRNRKGEESEAEWHVFGIRTAEPLEREDVERIMAALSAPSP